VLSIPLTPFDYNNVLSDFINGQGGLSPDEPQLFGVSPPLDAKVPMKNDFYFPKGEFKGDSGLTDFF
jgi:hypothetical protein